MGRRSRARERAAASVAAGPEPAAPARDRGWRRWARLLNPFAARRRSRSRARKAAAAFAVAAAGFAVVGWVSGQPAWFDSAVLLAILAVSWGLLAAYMGGDRSG